MTRNIGIGEGSNVLSGCNFVILPVNCLTRKRIYRKRVKAVHRIKASLIIAVISNHAYRLVFGLLKHLLCRVLRAHNTVKRGELRV